jgi:hypothetical protein
MQLAEDGRQKYALSLSAWRHTATADLVTNIWGFDKVPECTGRSVTLWI